MSPSPGPLLWSFIDRVAEMDVYDKPIGIRQLFEEKKGKHRG